MKQKQVELLAPAGSFESLQAAIRSGANAVYFGVEQLNMRAGSAKPFTTADIKEVAKICHAAGAKAYITLNTIMYDHDAQLVQSILKEVKKHKIDAVIAADFAVISVCREMGIPVHISTQANVSNIEAVKFFSTFADVIVPARELTLKQVEQMTREISRKKITGPSGELVKIEIFVHGALCMAVSGKCYLSLHSNNASANRGACVQNCRRPYNVTDPETGDAWEVDGEYIMSPKDLCTIGILDQVINAGVTVLKIEGRSKGPDYVHTVTSCYREAMTAIKDGTYDAARVEVWEKKMSAVYNRGFWEGYYLGRQMGEWTKQPGSIATEKKIYLGKGAKYYPKIKVGEFVVESGQLKQGDTIMITSPNFGMIRETLDTLMVNGEPAQVAEKGDRVTLPVAEKVSVTAKLYKVLSEVNA